MIRWKRPDGGKESGVKCWGIEIKWLFSIVLLRFEPNDRENYHSHAFNALTFWLKGRVSEKVRETQKCYVVRYFEAGNIKYTPRTNTHKIHCTKTAWALSFRGPWQKEWTEVAPEGRVIKLTKGRKVL